MQYLTRTVASILLLLIAGIATTALAQQSAPERAASLRAQLAEVQAKQIELQARLQQLDEALKPENIANGLAGVGSVHPEELREQSRRKLANERAGVSAQFDQLTASRTRLETALQEAEINAYHQSAWPDSQGVNPKAAKAAGVDSQNAPRQSVPRRRSRPVRRHKAKRIQNPER